ncbi:UNVERIFIED_CONTAM: hypothetical protein K2H54_050318 [Gekko kuhli]
MRKRGLPVKWDSCLAPRVPWGREGLQVRRDNRVLLAHQAIQVNTGTQDQWDPLVPAAQKALQENLVKMVNRAEQDRLEKLGFQVPRAIKGLTARKVKLEPLDRRANLARRVRWGKTDLWALVGCQEKEDDLDRKGLQEVAGHMVCQESRGHL